MEKTPFRVAYVDIVKGFAICAVVLMHISYLFPKNELINVKSLFGYFWHVPVFFIVAGFFIRENKLERPWEFIKGKLKGLYLPALYIYLIAALLHNVLFDIGWYASDISYGGKIINNLGGGASFIKNIILVIVCAGREPIVGAMWFVYVLLFSLIGFATISFLCKRIVKSENDYEGYRLVIFTFLQLGSCLMSNQFGYTMPRCSNVFSTMLLIFIGQQIYQRFKLKFDNGYIALMCAVFVYQGTLLMGNGLVTLNENGYNDMMQLTFGSVAALYVLCYIGRKIENSVFGKFVSYLGSESFDIMCLHIVGFHLCTELMIWWGVIKGGRNAWMTPEINDFWVVVIYFLFGILFPCAFMAMWRKILRLLIHKC